MTAYQPPQFPITMTQKVVESSQEKQEYKLQQLISQKPENFALNFESAFNSVFQSYKGNSKLKTDFKELLIEAIKRGNMGNNNIEMGLVDLYALNGDQMNELLRTISPGSYVEFKEEAGGRRVSYTDVNGNRNDKTFSAYGLYITEKIEATNGKFKVGPHFRGWGNLRKAVEKYSKSISNS